MALVTANGVGVLRGTIERPRSGVRTADLVLDQATGFDPGTQVIVQSDGVTLLTGVVDPDRAGDFLDASHVRLIGGAGGMAKTATPRGFMQPNALVSDIVNALVGDAGEALSSTTDQGFLSTNVTAWSTLGKTINWNLRALLGVVAPTMTWRILSDGTLWIGTDTWPTASGTFDTIKQDPADGSYDLGIEAPFVEPGTALDGIGNVNLCVDIIAEGKLRTKVYVDLPDEGDRGIEAAIGRMVRQATAGIDYYATYLCQVVTQSSDLTTVSVNPVGQRNQELLGALGNVPVRAATTGVKVQFAPNATVLLAWDGGDPRSPYVFGGLSGDSALALQLLGNDPVITKADMTALISAITSMASTGNSGGSLTFTAPAKFGSTTVGAGR